MESLESIYTKTVQALQIKEGAVDFTDTNHYRAIKLKQNCSVCFYSDKIILCTKSKDNIDIKPIKSFTELEHLL